MNEQFPTYVRSQVERALRAIPSEDRADIYVVSFFVYDEDDDPRRPVLTVGTNTETQVEVVLSSPTGPDRPRWTPSDDQEARWNYAFWLQDLLVQVGDSGVDPVGAELRAAWLKDLDLWFEEHDDSDEAFALGSAMTSHFVDLCVELVRGFHESGLVVEVFGRAIPVVVHELEYYDEIAAQNRRANGRDLVAGLDSWIGSMYQ